MLRYTAEPMSRPIVMRLPHSSERMAPAMLQPNAVVRVCGRVQLRRPMMPATSTTMWPMASHATPRAASPSPNMVTTRAASVSP